MFSCSLKFSDFVSELAESGRVLRPQQLLQARLLAIRQLDLAMVEGAMLFSQQTCGRFDAAHPLSLPGVVRTRKLCAFNNQSVIKGNELFRPFEN
jgi:hypothetical protein